jgi:hypothetical protein
MNKPIAWIGVEAINSNWSFGTVTQEKRHKSDISLYTHPVKELTDEEIANTWDDVRKDATLKSSMKDIQDFARAILRKAQEK